MSLIFGNISTSYVRSPSTNESFTMSNPLMPSGANGDKARTNLDNMDDASFSTPKAGVEIRMIDHELKELTIRFEFQPKNTDAAKKCAIVHTHLLLELQIAFEEDVKIFNNKNKELPKIDPIHWNSPAIHQRNFVIHCKPGTQRRKSKYVILHRIHTNQSLSTIKNYHTIAALLKNNDCWLKNHDWDESVWDTVQAGHLIGINPAHYTPIIAAQKLARQIEKKVKTKLPPIRLIYSSPRSSPSGGKEVRSKGYAVEFARADAAVVLRALKDTFAGTRLFLMAKLRYTHPIAYANALKLQNQHLAAVYVLPLLNVTEEALFYFEAQIKDVEGVTDIVPTRHSDTTGRFNILINKSHFKSAKAEIVQSFDHWYNEVPSSSRPHEEAFSGLPRIGTQGADDESTGEQSFLSLSAASFASMDMSTGPHFVENYTPTSATYSWSQVTQCPRVPNPPIPIAVVQPTQVSDLTVSLNTELESLKQQFSNLQAKSEEQRVQDQEKIVLLTKALDRQEAMLQKLITQIIPQPSRQDEPVEKSNATDTTSQTSTILEMDSEMADTTDTDSSKRDNDEANEAVHPSTQESSKRIDARPSPQKQPDFHQHE